MLGLATPTGGAAAGKVRDELCPRCGQHVGSWRDGPDGPAFHPHPPSVRRVAWGGPWLRFNCKQCDERITLDHGGRAT